MANDKLVKAVVAKGRTVTVGKKDFGPGEEVSLPLEEVEQLRERGFLVDPNAAEVPRGNGPTFGVEGEPQVKVAA